MPSELSRPGVEHGGDAQTPAELIAGQFIEGLRGRLEQGCVANECRSECRRTPERHTPALRTALVEATTCASSAAAGLAARFGGPCCLCHVERPARRGRCVDLQPAIGRPPRRAGRRRTCTAAPPAGAPIEPRARSRRSRAATTPQATARRPWAMGTITEQRAQPLRTPGHLQWRASIPTSACADVYRSAKILTKFATDLAAPEEGRRNDSPGV